MMVKLSKRLSFTFLFFLWMGISAHFNLLYGQLNTLQIQKNYHGTSLIEFIEEIEQQHTTHFFFRTDWIKEIKIRQGQNPMALTKILDSTFMATSVSYFIQGNNIYLSKGRLIQANTNVIQSSPNRILRKPEPTVIKFSPVLPPKPKSSINTSETVISPPTILKIGENNNTGRTKATIVGYVRDIIDGEPLIGAAVFVDELSIGTNTDQYGYYSLTLPNGKHMISFRFYGKEEKEQEINLLGDGFLDMELEATILELDEVVIESEQESNISSTQMGLTNMNIQTLKQMPALMGEIDVIKSTLMLPGVQSLGEGANGFNVRGGNADQNLILINQAPIFNPTHLFGFFSVFNPDIIKNFDLYKGGIPARYGGRLSSVLDISMKDGNKRELVGSGGIGPMTTRLTLEGPIKKNRSSFILGGRGTYSDWILRRLEDPELRNSSAGYYDLNGKINLNLSEKDRLDFSGYFSRDRFVLNGDTAYSYRNINGAINWKHLFNNKLFALTSAIYSQYDYTVSASSAPKTAFEQEYQIRYHEAKTDFTFIPQPEHEIRFGLNAIRYSLNPGSRRPFSSESLLVDETIEKEQAIESGVYLSDEWEISPRLDLYAGLRYSFYFMLGPNELATYSKDLARIPANIIGSTQYEAGELVQSYSGPEGRLSLRYALNDQSAIKFSYNRLRQYLHMLSNTTSISPTDTWKLSDPYIRPQIGDQLSLGYYHNFRQNAIETSVEVYVKRIKDMLEFKGGAQLLLNPNVETDIINGQGRCIWDRIFSQKGTWET